MTNWGFIKISLIAIFIFNSCYSFENEVNNPSEDETKGLVTINGRQYYIATIDVDMGFVESARHCESMNMSLVSFETREEFDAVQLEIASSPSYIYYMTSGVYLKGGYWMWSSIGKIFPNSEGFWSGTLPNVSAINCDYCIYITSYGTGYNYRSSCNSGIERLICEQKGL